MALKTFQKVLTAGVLYAIENLQYTTTVADTGLGQLQPNLEVIGGTVNVYGSQQSPFGSAPTNMYETATGFSGIAGFFLVPNYLYITVASGTPIITLSGIGAAQATS